MGPGAVYVCQREASAIVPLPHSAAAPSLLLPGQPCLQIAHCELLFSQCVLELLHTGQLFLHGQHQGQSQHLLGGTSCASGTPTPALLAPPPLLPWLVADLGAGPALRHKPAPLPPSLHKLSCCACPLYLDGAGPHFFFFFKTRGPNPLSMALVNTVHIGIRNLIWA